jgi:hypothetical protein
LWLTFTLFAHAQAVPSASEGTTNEQLLRRIEQLEQRLKEMEAREAARMSESATPAAVAAADAAVTAAPAKVASSTMASMDTATAHSAQDLNNPHLHIRGYADAGFFASTNTPDDPESNSHFALGQFNLFMTSRLSQRANVLAELVVESNAHNSVGLDLERLLFNYSIADALNVSVGRYHTAIGYYNTAYHHSGWMQTAIDRPFIFNFEDDGGILPIHNVGISLAGRIPSGGLGLHYIAEIGNGRTSRTRFDEAVQTSVDENGHKSFNLALSVHPEKWYGLQAGVSFYSDRLTPGAGTLLENPSNPFPTDVAARPRIDERIFSAYAVYQNTRFEFLNEALLLQHHLDGYRTFDTPGFYTQISNRFGSWRPYVRFQYVNANRYEPVFGDAGLRYGPSAGIRFDFNEFAAFKVQYDRTMLRDESSRNGVGTQVAFTF